MVIFPGNTLYKINVNLKISLCLTFNTVMQSATLNFIELGLELWHDQRMSRIFGRLFISQFKNNFSALEHQTKRVCIPSSVA